MNALKPLPVFRVERRDSLFQSKSSFWGRLTLFAAVLAVMLFSQPDTLPAQPAPSTAEAKEELKEKGKRPVDHLIYIPYDRLNEVIDRLKSKVVLSYEEYLDLVKRAGKRPAEIKPNAQAVVSTSKYSALVNGDVVEITATYNCKAIKKNWAELPLNLGQAAVGEISSKGGKKVLLRGTGEGKYSLLFESAGEYQVTLKLLVQIKRSPAGPRVDLTLPPVAITKLRFVVPQADQQITITPRHIVIDNETPIPEKNSGVTVSLGATEKVSITWTPRSSDRPEMDLLTRVTNQMQISIRDGLIHTDARLNYRILRGETKLLRVAVPLDQRILDVTSTARIQAWTVKKEEKRQVVEVKLLSEAKKDLTLEIHTERSLPSNGAIALGGMSGQGEAHGIHALDVTRENGTISITHGKELTLVIDRQSGLVRTDSGEKERSFRYFSPAFDFVIRTEPVRAILDLKHDAFVVFREQRIEVVSQMQYTIRRTGLFHLAMQLPKDFSLTGVECRQMAEFQHDKKKQTLAIVLKQQFQGTLSVTVRGYVIRPKEELATETSRVPNLPLIEPQGIRQEQGRIAVFTIDAIELVADEDKIESAQAIPVNTIRSKFPDTEIRAAWKFQSRPVLIPVSTIRRPTRLTAQTATTARVEPSGTIVETIINYNVQYAGIDRFYIAVPREVSERIQITIAGPGSVPIQQKSPLASNNKPPEGDNKKEEEKEGQANPDAWVIWMIKTQRPVTGTQQFKVTYDLPLQQSNEGEKQQSNKQKQETAQQVLLIQPRGANKKEISSPELSRASGEVVVHVDPALSLGVNASGQGVEAIDIRELKLLAGEGQQAFRYSFQSTSDPIQLTLTISRHEVESVVSTVVSRTLTEFVLGASKKLAVRSRMRIKSSQRQRLMIKLPSNVQPMLVLLNGETRELQKGEAEKDSGWVNYFVNVSRPGNSEQEFYLTLQYLQPVSPLTKTTLRGGLNLSMPALFTPEGVAAVVQQSRAVLWLPDEYVPVTVEKPYQRVQRPKAASFISGIQDDSRQVNKLNGWIETGSAAGFDFPTNGKAYLYESIGAGAQLELTYWSRLLATAALSIALMLIALVLMRTSWENKILVLIVVGTVLSAILQFQPEMVKQGISSAQYGILALFLIWGIHGLFQCRHCCKAEICTTGNSSEPVELKTEPVEQSEQRESSESVLDIPEQDQPKEE